MAGSTIEVKFVLPVGDISETHRAEAEQHAREAFVLTLLRQGAISAGRAAELLNLDRWQLGELMAAHHISPFDDTMTAADLQTEVNRGVRLR